jgi:hypothetical protein
MRIAFDLDDTLIPCEHDFPIEPWPGGLLARWFAKEPLRLGTVELLNKLWRQGHQVWVYTTSVRKPFRTKMMFRCYGTRVAKVINEDHHQSAVRRLGDAYKVCTKFPPAFGIDVLIDNSHIVQFESRTFEYEMILVHPQDHNWVDTVLEELGAYEAYHSESET